MTMGLFDDWNDDRTPTENEIQTVVDVAPQQRLTVETLVRARDGGRMAGLEECRRSCDTIHQSWLRGVALGATMAAVSIVAFALLWRWVMS